MVAPTPATNVPIYKRPLFVFFSDAFNSFNPPTEANIQKDYQSIKKAMDEEKGWIKLAVPFLKFALKRNPVELGGAAATFYGAVAYVASLIGLDRLAKWGGIILGGVGIVAAVVGKLFLGISLKAPATEPEPKNKPETDK